ncbi:MAG: FlgO family outer membrane protein [Phycisphaerales bacterium]|jgi:TolB-like protein|nr:FlgO family outer membrane protein [Phycisphaerales bacterium]
MMKKSLLLLGTALVAANIQGCEAWNHHRADHWEQGKQGAANWKVNNDRDAQDQILVLDRTPTRLPLVDANYEKTSYNAISHLLATAHPPAGQLEVFNPDRAVMYSTTVNLNDYSKTTNFGRLQAEALSTALIQHWQNDLVKVTLRQSTTPIIPQQGEFLLSREIRDLSVDFNVGAVLVSTYSVALDKVYMNVQLINVDYNTVVAAVTYDMPLGPRTRAMLENVEIASKDGDLFQ